MTLKEDVSYASENMSKVSNTAILDAQLLVCHACNIERTKLIANPEIKLSESEQVCFSEILQRRNQGEPLAYITGEKEFWSLPFKVNKYVLIPRPETELLVEKSLELINEIDAAKVLDLGTGSGAIAISLARERNDCGIVATDISPDALDVARQNASRNDANITFVQSDWYKNVTTNDFDLIICNPPYVAKDDVNLDQYVTDFEPHSAVMSNKNGMQDIEHIIQNAPDYLSKNGFLLIEHGFQQKNQVQELFQMQNFQLISSVKDLSGNNRAIYGHI